MFQLPPTHATQNNENMQVYNCLGVYTTHLYYKSRCLSVTQILLCTSIYTIHFSCYKLGCIHHYLLYHKGALNIDELLIKAMTILQPIYLGVILGTYIFLTYISCKILCLFVAQIQIHKSRHAFLLSYCKFDYNFRCLSDRKDVLKI